MANHDLIVLGAGSAGLATSFRAATHGARVALLDPGELGGTCVHRGCVPKKALWYAAEWAQAQQFALAAGFASQPGALDWAHYGEVRKRYIDAISRRYAERLRSAGVQLIAQAGRFIAVDTIELADGSRLKAAQIVIATGARPRRLALPGFDLGVVSDDMFALHALPRRMTIVGGGYVAVEFAGLLQALGSEVEVLAHGSLLEGFDVELTHALQQHMEAQGIRVHLHSAVQALHRNADGSIRIDDAGSGSRGSCDSLLWAVGRVPNSVGLGLDDIGVATGEHGHILTDVWQDTNVPGIHAVGDVGAQKALTPVAVAAGRRLADRLFGSQRQARLDNENIPSVVFSEPPLGMVGLTEQVARDLHGDAISVHCSRFTPMPWALTGRSGQSLMKLVCVGEDERVLGIHVLGPGADEMLQGFAVALKLGLHKRDLDSTVAIHPTAAEELVLMD